ncbi:histone deacetylase 8-like isoform X2 [Portunus trituberculatus]|uniref:histone deacetylase 8-like isoform X2 n=1 Tax=Portunus trituberculatus TaxID=210409 RepID=UPI001E1CEB00|nr:histone deacetylase 8-like isoform X2 [Portunus trituberculatus]
MLEDTAVGSKGEVVYVADPKLLSCSDAIPAFRQRACLTHALITSYGLHHKMRVVPSEAANEEDIRKFHSQDYVEFLQKDVPEEDEDKDAQDEFGLGFDCPFLDNLWGLVCGLVGGSLTAARELTSGRSKIALNWCGGWHHAQRDMASGFCYVNDIVLAVLHLRSAFPKVLYIDLDVHHGDGVENAYLFSPKVVTLSLHQREIGFYPTTGAVEDIGLGKGKFYTLNVPYKEGINDTQFIYLFESILYPLCEVFMPDAVVCQCGADALSQDPLGGGGYNKSNTAKLWTAITATVLKCPVSTEIPEHQFFHWYGPDFELEVTAGLQKSSNTQESLDQTIKAVHGNIQKLAESLEQK